MGSVVLFLCVCLFWVSVSGASFSEFVYPNFTASNLQFVDSYGSFLVSRNGTFKASIYNPGAQQTNFYLCVIHALSNTIIWSANRDAPISNSGKMILTMNGINITTQDGSFKWSTPQLQSPVSALQLREDGNLVLLDRFNNTLWESFRVPTDTIVIGQHLPAGNFLSSAASDNGFSTGNYKLAISSSDAILQWKELTYWKLSMDSKAYSNTKYDVDYMAINQTGLYLFGHNGSVIIIQVFFSKSNFRIARIDHSGQFVVSSFSGADTKHDFVGPADKCRIPFICGQIGLCSDDAVSNTPVCSCPSNFRDNISSQNTSSCEPTNASYSLPVSCNSSLSNSRRLKSSVLSYLSLGYGVDYFANVFTMPDTYGTNLSVCQDLCSDDCSCLGIFFASTSASCYKLKNELGSFVSDRKNGSDRLGFIKILAEESPINSGGNNTYSGRTTTFPTVALVFLLLMGLFLLVAVLGFLWWRWSSFSQRSESTIGHPTSPSSDDLDSFSIPGLPIRFEYEEIASATESFKTKIGSGGFGSVYKGMLPDKTMVAVKKISNLGIQGKRDFCTEIAVIGNIHHLNLVKLKGFCAQGNHRLLVYDYMNRGSLDRSLFGGGVLLEWQERIEIAIGTARGLAYLHAGCEQKIIHCDVKPENILLHDNIQAKISDFGLSKLLSPEQSSLFTTMRGTRGYLAPEWLTNSAISEKTDVYSFGMVLLEIVSGRKNCHLQTRSHSLDDGYSGCGHSSSSSGSELVYFPLFALEMHEQGRYMELADPRLQGRITNTEIEKLVCISLCCVHEEPVLRPNMVTVVGMLEDKIPVRHPRMDSLNFLRFYGRRFTEASMIEENSRQNDFMLHPRMETSHTSGGRDSNASFSYLSSQQISGPR